MTSGGASRIHVVSFDKVCGILQSRVFKPEPDTCSPPLGDFGTLGMADSKPSLLDDFALFARSRPEDLVTALQGKGAESLQSLVQIDPSPIRIEPWAPMAPIHAENCVPNNWFCATKPIQTYPPLSLARAASSVAPFIQTSAPACFDCRPDFTIHPTCPSSLHRQRVQSATSITNVAASGTTQREQLRKRARSQIEQQCAILSTLEMETKLVTSKGSFQSSSSNITGHLNRRPQAKARNGQRNERDYICGYCGRCKSSNSGSSDGRVRIRCECGGKRKDGVRRMHASWTRVNDCDSAANSFVDLPACTLLPALPIKSQNPWNWVDSRQATLETLPAQIQKSLTTDKFKTEELQGTRYH